MNSPFISVKPSIYQFFTEVCYFSPLRNSKRLTIMCKNYCCSFIVGLFFTSGPLTIARGIISIIINSVNTMLVCGPLTHIGYEVFKGINPTLAHADTSASPIGKTFVVGIITTIFHAGQRFIFNGTRFPVSCFHFFSYLFMQTSTGFSLIIFKIVALYNSGIATIANTIPPRAPFPFVGRSGDNSKLVKLFANQVNKIFRLIHNNDPSEEIRLQI